MRVSAGLLLVWLAVLPARAAQVCDTTAYPLSTPTSRFTDNEDGTVTDTRSGLIWMRCALGQSWNRQTCAGSPIAMSWQAAEDAAASLNRHAGLSGQAAWRLPRITQLAMIAERQCSNPRINLALFPATPAAVFWSASARRSDPSQVYILSFGPEGTGDAPKTDKHFARLVRAGP